MSSWTDIRQQFVLLHDQSREVQGLVSHHHRSRVIALTGDLRPFAGAEAATPPQRCGRIGDVACIVVDGPRPAFELVAAKFARRGPNTVIAVSLPDGTPPPWWTVQVLIECGAVPGVDMRKVRWHTADGLWWTGPSGAGRLPLRLQKRSQAVEAAQVLTQVSGFAQESPVGGWLHAIANQEITSDPEVWNRVLCAQFIEMTLDHFCIR